MHDAPLGPERTQPDSQKARHCQRTWLRTMKLLVIVLDCLINQLSKEILPIQLTNQIIRKLNSKRER